MNAWAHGGAKSLSRALDIVSGCAGQGSDDRARHSGSYSLHSAEVTIRRDRETRFNNVNSQLVQLARQTDLFLHIHAAAGRLLTVAQSGIEDRYPRAIHSKLHYGDTFQS